MNNSVTIIHRLVSLGNTYDYYCYVIQSGCTNGDLRLNGAGFSSTQGRVELCHINKWGTICDDSWGSADAQVACKQLKYSSHGNLTS